MLAEFAKKNLHLSLNALAANAYGLQCGELEWGGTGLRSHPTSSPVPTTRVE